VRSDSPELTELEQRHAREVSGRLTYREALSRFTALWVYARRVNPDFPAAWQDDIAADIELARVLNAHPRAS
jgi:hypothetical protein